MIASALHGDRLVILNHDLVCELTEYTNINNDSSLLALLSAGCILQHDAEKWVILQHRLPHVSFKSAMILLIFVKCDCESSNTCMSALKPTTPLTFHATSPLQLGPSHIDGSLDTDIRAGRLKQISIDNVLRHRDEPGLMPMSQALETVIEWKSLR